MFADVTRRQFLTQASAGILSAHIPLRQNAQEQAALAAFTDHSYSNARGEKLAYRLLVPPGYDKRTSYPLVLWLHGGNGRGAARTQPNTGVYRFLALPENRQQYPAFMVVPLSPARPWVEPGAKPLAPALRLALEILTAVRAEFKLDQRRVYVLGTSAGGYATWDLLARQPAMFAAAVPICGGGDPAKAKLIARTPLWAFHGELDQAVPVEESRRMIAAIRQAGGTPKFTEYPGVGHDCWTPALAEPELLPWMFGQRRAATKAN